MFQYKNSRHKFHHIDTVTKEITGTKNSDLYRLSQTLNIFSPFDHKECKLLGSKKDSL